MSSSCILQVLTVIVLPFDLILVSVILIDNNGFSTLLLYVHSKMKSP